MSVFQEYARYYNLLYRDKDYVGETQFVDLLLQQHAPGAHSILELGCGTSHHALLLAQKGYEVHGVDVSSEMLKQAHDRLAQWPGELNVAPRFYQGDIRQIRLNCQFEAVISLFHVVSYQTSNEDLERTFETARTHLKPEGLFLFDCWYGPAVLNAQPVVRIKRLENEETSITRIAEPVMFPNENRVDVNYHIFIKDKQLGTITELQETHRMRYLFIPEIKAMLKQHRLKIIEAREWMTNFEPGVDSWSVYFVCRKSKELP